MLKDNTRIGSTAAILGSVLLLVGTWLHPMSADPNVPSAAFAEYAADHYWVASHLTQLMGITLMMAALVMLSRRMAEGPAAVWATLGAAGAIASIALAGALQAVDGVALKAMVDSWATSAEPRKAPLFEAAFGVRQIEIGLAAMTGLISGLAVSIYGIALLIDHRFPRWIGIGALVGGPPTAVAGVVTAYTGFSPLSMSINMPAGLLVIFWMIALGVYSWRRSILAWAKSAFQRRTPNLRTEYGKLSPRSPMASNLYTRQDPAGKEQTERNTTQSWVAKR